MKRILFVDDEPNVLSGLRRSLFQQRDEWDMHFVESGAAALQALADGEPFDVLVSDMRMPEMSGEELLQAVADDYPHMARLVLSGHAERGSAVRAAGVAHQFLAKPCDPEALKRAVSRTCYLRSQLNDPGVLNAVAGLGQLPSLPRIYRDVAAEVKSDDPTLEKVANLISADLGMSAKVLQLVNSAYFGLGRRVEDVRNAASLLGLDVIHDLVLANSAFAALSGKVDEQALEAEWRHGFRVATVLRLIAQPFQMDKITLGELSLAATLHDIGKVALLAKLPERYATVRAAVADGADELEAERAELGCTHAEISGTLLGIWGLSDTIVEAVTLHHDAAPGDGNATEYAPLLAIANHLCNAFDAGSDTETVTAALGASAFADRIGGWYDAVAAEFASEGAA